MCRLFCTKAPRDSAGFLVGSSRGFAGGRFNSTSSATQSHVLNVPPSVVITVHFFDQTRPFNGGASSNGAVVVVVATPAPAVVGVGAPAIGTAAPGMPGVHPLLIWTPAAVLFAPTALPGNPFAAAAVQKKWNSEHNRRKRLKEKTMQAGGVTVST